MPNFQETALWRKELCQSEILPTGFVETQLLDGLPSLLEHVDSNWLTSERLKHVRLGEAYLTEPISFIGTARIESATSDVHYYARALFAAQDFLTCRPDYDFYFGTRFIGELAKLGQILPIVLSRVPEATEKIASLYAKPSSEAASTMYEILVAGASALHGREVRFEQTLPGIKKTPDIRVSDMKGFVIECKRKKILSDYEQREEKIARTLFGFIRQALLEAGLSAVIEIEFDIELETLDQHDVIRSIPELLQGQHIQKSWGKLWWRSLPPKRRVTRTKLYSPKFLNEVFGWSDIPTHDGMVCQVESSSEFIVDNVCTPICLKWKSTSEAARRKKVRAVSSLVATATEQIPEGENGIVYVCYNETARGEIADHRTKLIAKQLSDWTHSAKVRVPLIYINRLYTTPTWNGGPDLIENVVKLQADYAAPDFFNRFPAAVFTKPR